MKKWTRFKYIGGIIAILMSFMFLGCEDTSAPDENESSESIVSESVSETIVEEPITEEKASEEEAVDYVFSMADVPAYNGEPYVELNNNVPLFNEEDKNDFAFELYSNLDSLGRCGVASVNIANYMLPTEERGNIGDVKPSGWHTVKYEGVVEGNYLYNRCHLIGYLLTGKNDDERNLITGTRYFNVQGMAPFENKVCDYLEGSDNHVLYRVTPIFEGDNLVASGVTMEAYSVEDNGAGICFYVFVYNVQPGVEIDYKTGDSKLEGEEATGSDVVATPSDNDQGESKEDTTEQKTHDYVLNTNTHKFHYPECDSVKDMKEKNKKFVTSTREDVISQGYEPCQRCKP